MKNAVIAALWVTTLVYCALSLALGPSGLSSMARLRDDARLMRENVALLEARNAELDARWNALRSDPGSIALEGRELGYLAEGELALRLPMAREPDTALAGMVLARSVPDGLNPDRARLWALACGLAAAVLVLLLSMRQRRMTVAQGR